jgi:hypothetical protein
MDIKIVVEVDGKIIAHESRVDPRDASQWKRDIDMMVARDLGNERLLQPHELVMKGALRGISMHMDERQRRRQ